MASTFEALLLAQLNFLLNPPMLSAQDLASGTTSLPSGTAEKITLGTVSKDPYNGWSAPNNQWTVPVAGTYQVAGGVKLLTSTGTGFCLAFIQHNGVTVPQSTGEGPATGGGFDTVVPILTTQIPCAVGDTISLWAEQGTGATRTTDTGSTLEIRWVHA